MKSDRVLASKLRSLNAIVAFVLGVGVGVACGPRDLALGEKCDDDRECDDGLECGDDGATAGQCTRECRQQPDPCPEMFGDGAFCNDGGRCALECEDDAVCPDGTICRNGACDRG